ncbi:MAG TPA: hypothetical protein VHY08_05945 [Bacillota bacterium]|nr:hypothetical protein [Bacillota bacterium]
MSSFKTPTGPGTIYDRLVHPTDSANQDPTQADPVEDGPDAATSNNAVPEAPVQTGPETSERPTGTFAPVFRDPKS